MDNAWLLLYECMLLPSVAPHRVPGNTSWIGVAANSPYFVDDNDDSWTPIGQNDAVTWPDFVGLYRRRHVRGVESYLAMLAEHGVTCLRLMLEYSQTRHRYFERHPGEYNRDMVRLWDDLFSLCRQYGLRVLLTPFDTFWMWIKWKHHPYNKQNGGPCNSRRNLMLCADTRTLIKRRLEFATERWGRDGTIFAWDLWNEIHPAHAGNCAGPIFDFVEEISVRISVPLNNGSTEGHTFRRPPFLLPLWHSTHDSGMWCIAILPWTSSMSTCTSAAQSTIPRTQSMRLSALAG